MSHVVKLEQTFDDLDMFERACEAIGLELVRGQTRYKWYGTHVGDYPLPAGFTKEMLGKCEHVARVKGAAGAYEIGLVRLPGEQGYTLVWDFWGSQGAQLQRVAGDKCGNLLQRYNTEAAIKQAKREGFRVNETKLPDGRIKLSLIR